MKTFKIVGISFLVLLVIDAISGTAGTSSLKQASVSQVVVPKVIINTPTLYPSDTPVPTEIPIIQPTAQTVIQSHTNTSSPFIANGATGKCNDGTETFALHHQGACSHHGGIAYWY